MKFAIFLLDGMADYPLDELGGKTPLEAARTPVLDSLAKNAQFGTFLTLPAAFPTSSDVANMSVLVWDLASSYTGRGATQDDGRLLLVLTNGAKEVRVSGPPDKLLVEEAR